MNEHRSRVLDALSRISVDRPPCICPGGMMNMVTTELIDLSNVSWPEAHCNPQMMASLAYESYRQGCFENVGVPFCMTVEADAFGAQVTLGTIDQEPHVTNYALHSLQDMGKLHLPSLEEGRLNTVIEAIRILKQNHPDVPLIGNVTGPVSVASSVADSNAFYKALRKTPGLAHEFMAFIAKGITDFALAQAKAGADIICISDPSGTGEILGPKLFGEYTLRYLNMILDELKPTGTRTIVHICGQMSNVFPQVAQVRSDALSFDAIVSLEEANKKLPNHAIVGNVSTFALELGNPDKIAQLTRRCVKHGSNLVSPACGLGMHSPLSNIKEILNTLKEDEEKEQAHA